MKPQIDAEVIQKLLSSPKQIYFLWAVGILSIVGSFLFIPGTVPQIGLLLVGGIAVERGEQKYWLLKKLGVVAGQ